MPRAGSLCAVVVGLLAACGCVTTPPKTTPARDARTAAAACEELERRVAAGVTEAKEPSAAEAEELNRRLAALVEEGAFAECLARLMATAGPTPAPR
jgi:hypothetical protein